MPAPRPIRIAPVVVAVLLAALAAPCARADEKPWEPPKDGVLTPKQADRYIEMVEKVADRRVAYTEAGKKREPTMDDLHRMEAEVAAIEKSSGLVPEEREWVGKQFLDITVLDMQKKDFDEQVAPRRAEVDARCAAAEKELATVVAARKAGRRILNAEEREAAKGSAEAELEGAKAALADAESRAKETPGPESDQAVKDAQVALAAAKRYAADPDLPRSEDEKTALASELAQREEAARTELDEAKKEREEVRRQLAERDADWAKRFAGYAPKTIELVRPREARYDAAFKTTVTGERPAKQ
jgi:chromosome segregation ATPase